PVFTVWGACEDVGVLEKLRSGEYKINNLHIIDEAHSRLLEIGGVKLRLLGLGGAVVMHKLFDNGEGKTTIAGGQGTMWTTLLQMGELIDTANRVYDPTETRVFVTHASPAREGLLNQLCVTLKADFSISAGLHFRYGSSYNEFSVNPTLDHYRGKLAASRASFNDVWETVKHEVQPVVDENESQKRLLQCALEVVEKMPTQANGGNPFGGGQGGPATGQVDESAFKNTWNFNLADAAFGYLVLDIEGGRIGTEMRAQGFNFSHRGGKVGRPQGAPATPLSGMPPANNLPTPSTQQPPMNASMVNPTSTAAPQPPAPAQQPRAPPSGPSAPASVLPPHARPPPSAPTQTPQAPKPSQTPQTGPPPATTNGTSTAEKAIPSEVKPNGATPAPTAAADTKPATPATTTKPADLQPREPPKPSTGIFVPGMDVVTSEDDVKAIFLPDDQTKVQRVERDRANWVVHFASPEEMQEVLKHGADRTGKAPHLKLKEYMARRGGGGFGGASRWGPGRGAPSAGGVGRGDGYKSGGASDSESGRGGRGRGGFRGRGGNDSARGRGRGGRGGKPEGTGASPAPTPAAATATAASGGEA
ncbi:hypothetical protein LTR28_005905, partial [Elasticomyces elasticus]